MNLGEELRELTVEPLQFPQPLQTPEPSPAVPEPMPVLEPVEEEEGE